MCLGGAWADIYQVCSSSLTILDQHSPVISTAALPVKKRPALPLQVDGG